MVKIDAMFFSATEEPIKLLPVDQSGQEDQAPLKYLEYDTFILCNPNAMAYQHMINYPHAYYLKYFLNKQINCLVWNYRGYGRTKGTADPRQFAVDAEQVLNYLKLRIGVKGKIGIYGRSLGCICATHLQNQVDMVIADRGFCDLWTLSEKKFYGKTAVHLLKHFSFGWQVQNGYIFLKKHLIEEESCYKVVMCDLNDEIIDAQTSLMIGIARELCTKQFEYRKTQANFIDNLNDKGANMEPYLGILTDKQAQKLIDAMQFVLNLDYDLYQLGQTYQEKLEKEYET